MDEYIRKNPYFTWGCSDDLAFRLKKTLYCGEEEDCYDASSAALTDVAVSMLRESATCSRRKLSQRYASSLTRQLSISPCALMMSILYSERLRQLNPGYMDRISSSDLYVVSMLVATKFLHDEGEQEEIYNNEWAEASGLAVSTVNRLEREFLEAMDWNIYVHPEEFLTFCSKIETKIAFKYGLQRGWFSYTDLTQCLLAVQYQATLAEIFEKTVKIIGGCVLVYGMSLSLIISSVITYAATCSATANTLSNFPASANISYTGAGRTAATEPFDLYSERLFTRKRRLIRRMSNKKEAEQDYNENEKLSPQDMERLENSTRLLEGLVENTFNRESESCSSHTPSLRFETQYQHKTRQTRLSLSFDLKDLRTFHGGNYDTFDSSELESWSMKKNSPSACSKEFQNPLSHFVQRGPKNLMYDTKVFGMPVI